MAGTTKKLSKKEKDARSRQSAATAPAARRKTSSNNWPGIVAAILAIVIYANTLGHEYTLDDLPAITGNQYVQKGLGGIGDILSSAYWSGFSAGNQSLYRPVPLLVFALEWQFFPNNPTAGHFVNVLLFALTAFLLFRLLHRLFPVPIALAATLLFVAHPVHTEAVASIKSCDEILCFLFCILSLDRLLDTGDPKKKKALITSAIFFFLALLSKENAITWLAVFPLVLFVFRKASFRDALTKTVPHFIAAVLYLVILAGIQRGQLVTGSDQLTNHVLADAGAGERLATAFAVLGQYLFQLFVPIHLSMDYSFAEISILHFSDAAAWGSVLLVLSLVIAGILLVRKRNPLGFAILYLFITLSIVSNIPFLIGTIRADRLLYMPSLGAVIIIAAGLAQIFRAPSSDTGFVFSTWSKPGRTVLMTTLAVVLLFSVKTIARNPVWKNNLALLESGVVDAPNSAYAHYLYGNELVKSAHPDVPADSVHNDSLYAVALKHYTTAVGIDQGFAAAYSEMGVTYRKQKKYEMALHNYSLALHYNPDLPQAYNGLGVIYFDQKKYREAQQQFSKAVQLNSVDATALRNLGSCHLLLGESKQAIEALERSLQYNPNDASVYQYLSFAYEDLGDKAKANFYMEKAKSLQPR